MKKRKLLIGLLSAFVLTSVLGVAACEPTDQESGNQPTQMEQIYTQYIIHAQAEGVTPLSYEEWLEMIKGEKGDKGDKGDKGETGVGIEKVEYDENGNLVITFTDGSTQTVTAPEQHVHTFGDWISFTTEDVTCENRIFYHICETCSQIEWKNGTYAEHNFETVTTAPTCQEQGYDTKTCTICGKVEIVNYTPTVPHPWETEYSEDNSYHWYGCATCDDVKDKEEHTDDGSGNCSVCDYPIGPTAGIVYDISNGEARVVAYEGTATRVRIAETYNGAPVTEIASSAFYYCRSLTSLVIPDSVTLISNRAFDGCSSLTSVVIGDGVTSIYTEAFRYCDSLTSVYITDVAAWCNISFADYYANPLLYAKNLYLNNELVTELIIPDSVTSIGSYAFYNCDSLTSVVIPDSVTTIGSYAFAYCDSLTSVVIPDSVTTIGSSAFAGCNKLISEYNYVKYLKANDNPYFAVLEVTNKNFSTYTIHPDTKIIAYEAFYNCDSLTSVEIGDSVTSIGSYAFRNCDSLTSVETGDSVTSIGDRAFYECISLTSVEIGDSVTSIGDWAFAYCSSLTRVVIGDSVTSIGYEAFYNCSGLTNLTCPALAIRYISKGNLQSVVITSGESIGVYAFRNCDSLTSVVIPDSVTSIANYAFDDCDSLTSVVIPDSVTSINSSAFEGCDKLISEYNYVKYLKANDNPYFAVLGGTNQNFSTYTIHPDTKIIADFAFSSCTSLTSVVIGGSVTTIGDRAFDGCTSLTSVEIGDSVTSIGSSAFYDCRSLTSVVIGDSVTSIGDFALAYCTSLTSIKYRGTEEEWNAISKNYGWDYNTGSYTITYNYQG